MSQPSFPQDPAAQPPPQYGVQPPPQRANTVLVAMLVALTMALIFVLIYFLFLRDSGEGAAPTDTTTTTTTVVPGATTTVAGAAPTTVAATATTVAAAPTTAAPAPGATTAPAPVATTAPAPATTAAPAPPPTVDPCTVPTPSANFPLSVTIPYEPDSTTETFDLVPGDVLSIDINDVFSVGMDSFLLILDPNGAQVDFNDDKQPGDLMSALAISATMCGTYTAVIDAFQGPPTGDAQLTVTIN